jgi:sugar phosphate isomerase/epimerase
MAYEKTGGYRVGAVMLGKDLSPNFPDDLPRYELLYKAGYAAFQVFLLGCSDEYLQGLNAWAASKGPEEVEISGLLAFLNYDDTGTCPLSPNYQKRERAWQQVRDTFRKAILVGATGIHGPMYQGLFGVDLNGHPRRNQVTYRKNFLEFLSRIAEQYKLPVGLEVLNMHEFAPPGPTTLERGWELIEDARKSQYMKLLFDTCHQGQGEQSTSRAWHLFANMVGCIHFSDYGRTLLGQEQALTPVIFRYLLDAKLKTTIYVESVGADCNPLIQKALHVNTLPTLTGDEVLLENMKFIERKFAEVA